MSKIELPPKHYGKFGEGFSDVVNSLRRVNMTFYFAWGDTKARYRRSFLGPLWIVLTTAVSVAGLGFLWSLLLRDEPAKLVPSLTTGLVLWQFISGCILEAPTIFVRNSHFLRNMLNPYFIFPMQLLIRQLINLGHNFLVVILVLLIYPPHFGFAQLLIIPGFILAIANLAWIILLIGIIASRFRDLEQLIGALIPLMFFLSPVIYRPSQLSMSQYIIWLNPFSYLITLIRDPIMGVVPPFFVYVVSIIALLIGGLFTIYQFGKRHDKIVFWV